MKTQKWAIGLVILVTFITSSAQLLWKTGAADLTWNLMSIIYNWPLILGAILYAAGAFLLVYSFKGGEVTILFPIISTSYVWVTIGSWWFFNENINIYKILGVATIVIGIIVLSQGVPEDTALKYEEVV